MRTFIAKRDFRAESISDNATVLRGQVFAAANISELPVPWRTIDKQIFLENPANFWLSTPELVTDEQLTNESAWGNCS